MIMAESIEIRRRTLERTRQINYSLDVSSVDDRKSCIKLASKGAAAVLVSSHRREGILKAHLELAAKVSVIFSQYLVASRVIPQTWLAHETKIISMLSHEGPPSMAPEWCMTHVPDSKGGMNVGYLVYQ